MLWRQNKNRCYVNELIEHEGGIKGGSCVSQLESRRNVERLYAIPLGPYHPLRLGGSCAAAAVVRTRRARVARRIVVQVVLDASPVGLSG